MVFIGGAVMVLIAGSRNDLSAGSTPADASEGGAPTPATPGVARQAARRVQIANEKYRQQHGPVASGRVSGHAGAGIHMVNSVFSYLSLKQ